MNNKFRVIDYDIIYLSYDEPNAEKNYADLCSKIPWAKRVHGVKGSDTAHKACADLSETDRFITVDGDNVVDPEFLNLEIEFDNEIKNSVISFSAKNIINGLVYGNGGIKCWPKEYVLKMRTHEAADPRNKSSQVDFCWDLDYKQVDKCFSVIHNNASPQQAWRAGFREGVKLSLNRGIKPSKLDFLNNHWRCLHWLYIWTSVGSDVDNGLWAILGARAGLYKTMCIDWDYVNVRDFDYLNNLWENEFSRIKDYDVYDEVVEYGKKLKNNLNIPISINPLDADQSKFFKTVYINPKRLG